MGGLQVLSAQKHTVVTSALPLINPLNVMVVPPVLGPVVGCTENPFTGLVVETT
jgi:hypothetical protein